MLRTHDPLLMKVIAPRACACQRASACGTLFGADGESELRRPDNEPGTIGTNPLGPMASGTAMPRRSDAAAQRCRGAATAHTQFHEQVIRNIAQHDDPYKMIFTEVAQVLLPNTQIC